MSVLKNEKEVLFFPYTTFCLKNMYKGEYDNEFCFYVELDYLGQYEYIFDEFKKDKDFQSDVLNSIYFYLNSYANEVINRGLLPLNDNNNKSEIINEYSSDSEDNDDITSHELKPLPLNRGLLARLPYKVNNYTANYFDLSEFLDELKNLNEKLITINFVSNTGSWTIRCNPLITVSKMISYFLENFNGKTGLSIDELKKNICFLRNAEKLNFDTKTIKEKKIVDGAKIILNDIKNVLYQEEEDFKSDVL